MIYGDEAISVPPISLFKRRSKYRYCFVAEGLAPRNDRQEPEL